MAYGLSLKWRTTMHHDHSCFALGQGVSFCVEDGHVIVLDQIADRYLTLADGQHQAFTKIATGAPINAAEFTHLNRLVDEGLLVHTMKAGTVHSCSARVPVRAIPSSHAGNVRPLTQFRFAWRVIVARRRLKRRGLYKAFQALRLARTNIDAAPSPAMSALQEAADLLALIGRYMTRLDQCLPISLGLANHLLRQGVDCHVVVGIQLGPFRAHCWVQHGDHLVGDDLDIVRTFTPILVA